MNRLLILGIILALVTVVPALFGGQKAGPKDLAAAGKEVYAKRCASCHGASGEGKEAIAKSLKVTFRHLGSKEVQAKSDDQWRKDITVGFGKKTPVKLTKDELDQVIAFLRTLKQKAEPKDAAAGKEVYAKRCASCHGPSGEGKEAIAKSLKVTFRHLGSKEVRAKGDAQLRKDITEGVGKMTPVKLTKDELDQIIAYLGSLKQK